MHNIYRVNPEEVQSVKWMGDPVQYDLELLKLGQQADEFVVVNPNVVIDISRLEKKLPNTNRCVVWKCKDQWVAKKFKNNWLPEYGYLDIEIPPSLLGVKLAWTKNPDLDPLMTFEDDPFETYAPELTDCYYELVWHIDHRFNPDPDEVWVVKCRPAGVEPLGVKHMGYLIPKIKFEFNPDLPNLNLNVDDLCPAYYDLIHECAWKLDHKHAPFEDVWVAKVIPDYRPRGDLLWLGTVSPEFDVVYNKAIPKAQYETDYDILWRDFKYEHMWLLDKKHSIDLSEDIWVFKILLTKNPEGTKIAGRVSPTPIVEYNTELPPMYYEIDYTVPYHDLAYEHMWMLDTKHTDTLSEDIWAFKISYVENPKGTKIMDGVSPIPEIEYNPDLPQLDYDIDYTVPYHDLAYKHLWMLDKKHTVNLSEEIWAFKISYTDEIIGTKIVNSISPKLTYKLNNKVLPKLEYDIDYDIQYHDLAYSHVWMLDKKYCVNSPKDIWAIKVSAVTKPVETKIMGETSPIMHIEYNAELEGFDFSGIEHNIQYHDFDYTNVWMLDNDYSSNFDIWAMKINFVNNPIGYKDLGRVTPSSALIFNKDIKDLKIDIEYKIPYHDRDYVHVWYLDSEYANGQKIWAARMKATLHAHGEKDMGIVTPEIPDYLDVIFISYHEENAEENWQRVLEKAPWAKRIDGVKGIFEAHKAAAKLSFTDMFYVVDGDAYLTDDWHFNFQPGLFDRDCAYVWSAKNPINDLTYGYGGVKLFAKKQFSKVKEWSTLDMTTGIMPKLKIMSKVSNITAFNTDEFSTWRSAFRECVKLKNNMIKFPANPEHRIRFDKWKKPGLDREFGQFAIDAANQAEQFILESSADELLKINDMEWLKERFDTLYPKKEKNVRNKL
jgi:hypothetical protein